MPIDFGEAFFTILRHIGGNSECAGKVVMVIELGLIGGAAFKSAASAAAGKLAVLLVEKGKAKILPGELERALAEGLKAAQMEDGALAGSCHLCLHFDDKNHREFWGRVLEHPLLLEEFQKPLENEGSPDIDCLVKVFKQVAEELRLKLVARAVERWVRTFAQTYFDRTKAAIVFQVAKEQYLRQLAQRLDDVKFVGIAVPGDEVEKQEVLAQIFVMPDVRKDVRSNFSKADWMRSQRPRSPQVSPGYRRPIEERTLPIPPGQPRPIGERTLPIPFGQPRPIAGGKLDPLMNHSKQPPFLNNWRNADRQAGLLEEQKEWAMRDRSSPRISARDVLKQSKNKAVLLGAPGSGKTTLASYLGLMLANDPSQIGFDAEGDWLPIVVRIRDWILSPGMGLLEYSQLYAEKSLAVKSLPIGFFEYWLDRGQALILLDGLDEVVDEGQRRKVAEEIETFLHRYQDNPAVITSRPAGYRWDFFNLDEFPHYTLEPFDERQRNEFIEHWYDSRVKDDKAKADRLKADLQKAFKGNDRIQKLAENPLLLTIIALIHRYQAELPRQRFKLYEKAVETLLTSWDSGKELKLYEVLEYLKADDLLYVLKKLAYWIHDQGNAGETDGGTLIDKDELIQQLCKQICNLKSCKPHEAKQEAGRFVDFVQRRTGLLNEQGRDRYAFVHKTFQEYLTAEEIYDRFEEGEDDVILDHIRDHLHDGHWREVLLLLVSKLKKKRAEKAIEAVLNAGSEYEKWLHRDLLFAGWCLTEDPADLKAVAPKLVGEILDRLVAIEVGDTKRMGEKARNECAKIIHRLGGTAFEGEIWNRLNDCGGAIDRFRLIEFQASLGQEEKAIEILLYLLGRDEFHVSQKAASVLYSFINASFNIINELLNFMKDDKSNVSCDGLDTCNATYSLDEFNNRTIKVVNGVVSKIEINDFQLGRSVAYQYGSKFRSLESVNDLIDLLKTDDMYTRSTVMYELGQLTQVEFEVMSRLLDLLQDDDHRVASGSAYALGRLGNASTEVVNKLLNLLKDDDFNIRSSVVEIFGELGNGSIEVVDKLRNLLEDDNPNVRCSATFALAQLGDTSIEVTNELVNLLKSDNNFDVHFRVVRAFGKLDSVSIEVVNQLVSLLNNNCNEIRYRAIRALGELRYCSTDVVNRLVKLFEDDDSNIRFTSALSLGKLGNNSIEIVNGLLNLLKDDESHVRSMAASALGKSKSNALEVVNGLRDLLKDNDSTVRSRAAESLVQLSQKSEPILPAVLQWIETQPDDVPIGAAIDGLRSMVE